MKNILAVLLAWFGVAVDAGAAKLLRWNPTTTAYWDTVLSNWQDSATFTNTTFADGDSVLFDDAGAFSNIVYLTATVQPGSIVVNASSNYIVSASGGPGSSLGGTAGILKDGAGTLSFGGFGLTTYSGDVVVSNGIFRVLNGAALGSTAGVTRIRGGALDVNGQDLGNEVVVLNGTGPDGAGALVNKGTNAFKALRHVRLAGNATLGGTSRFDLTGPGGDLSLAGFELTKSGTNDVGIGAGITVLSGTVSVSGGALAFLACTSGADVVVNVYSGAAHVLCSGTGVYAHAVNLQGGRFATSNQSGPVIFRGPVTVANHSTIQLGTNSSLTITNAFGGPGLVAVTSVTTAASLILDVDATNTGGWLLTAGALQVGNHGTRGAAGTNAILNNGLLRFQRSDTITVVNALSGSGNVTHAGSGTVIFAGSMAVSGRVSTVNGGGLVFDGNYGQVYTVATPTNIRAFNVQGGAVVIMTNNAIVNMQGIVALGAAARSNCGHVVQYGGTWNVNGWDLSNYGRAFMIGEWPLGTSSYTMVESTLIATNGGFWVPWTSELGTWNMHSSTAVLWQLTFNYPAWNGEGWLNMEGGSLILGTGGMNHNYGRATLNIGGALIGAYASWTGTAALRITGTNGPVTFDPGTNRITLTKDLSGTGGIVKAGSGELVLNAYSTLTGTVLVTGGTLTLSNTASSGESVIGSARLTIQTGATVTAYINSFGLHESNSVTTSIVVNEGTLAQATNFSCLRDIALVGGSLTGTGSGFRLATNLVVLPSAIRSRVTADLEAVTNIVIAVADGPATNDLHLSGTLTSTNGGWTKTGTGTLVFDGAIYSSAPLTLGGGTFEHNGTIYGGDLVIQPGACLCGNGFSFTNIVNDGACAPGRPLGALSTALNYSQSAAGTLLMTLGGNVSASSDYARLNVGGIAKLGGTLRVALTNGFSPAYGDVFHLISAGAGFTNDFSRFDLPSLPSSNLWKVINDGTNYTLVVAAGLAPPVTYDGFSNLYALATGPDGDDDGDGQANLAEFAAGSNPALPDDGARLSLLQTNGAFTLMFFRQTNAIDISLFVESAETAMNSVVWTTVATNLGGSWGSTTNVTETGVTPVRVLLRDDNPATNRFLRLRITRP